MSNWTATVAGTLALGLFGIYIARRARASGSAYPLPPGPPGLPWVGNIIGVDSDAPWLTYAKWAKTYGDLIHSRLLGRDIIIINSEKMAKDLLEKRSSNYSDRPDSLPNELCGLHFSSIWMKYGDRWRLHRRFFHQTFRLEAAPRFIPGQHQKACRLLQKLHEHPDELHDHVLEYTSAIILNSTYDYDPASREDRLVTLMEDVLSISALVARPDLTILIGAFPLLLHLPSWFPGMSFKKKMAVSEACAKEYLETTFAHSIRKVMEGSTAPSMVSDGLRKTEETGTLPDKSWTEPLKEASGTAFLAGSETSTSVLMAFILMMVVNPKVQAKAQVQIDAVVGKGRLPSIEDRPLLPFVDAIFREILRYSPVAPLSVPHVAVEDDVYDGFHIPKGAMLLPNIWSIAHDESRFPNPYVFMPERFLNDDGSLKPNDMENIMFGFGRRICVGRHFADLSAWGVIAKMLAVFDILPPLDENGVEIPVEPKFSTGIAIHPLPFKCRVVPRFPGMDAKKLEQLITASTP